MPRIRVIPTLLLKDGGLVKTARFKEPSYVGDPINAVKIFNEKEVDEIAVIDISDSVAKSGPSCDHFAEIAGEAFMPLAYGGGVRTEQHAETLFQSGAEKVVLNTAAFDTPDLVTELASRFGSQSIVVSIDTRQDWLRRPRVFAAHGTRSTGMSPVEAAQRMEGLGAGELLIHDISREGTYKGFDLELVESITSAVSVPVIALGGARHIDDLGQAARQAGASAVAAGSMFVYNGPHKAVLISYPSPDELESKVFPT